MVCFPVLVRRRIIILLLLLWRKHYYDYFRFLVEYSAATLAGVARLSPSPQGWGGVQPSAAIKEFSGLWPGINLGVKGLLMGFLP